MSSTKAELIARLNELSQELIFDRTQADIDALIDILRKPHGNVTEREKIFIRNPQKGAYNPSDRNRVSEFCNKFVELMETYYGVITDGFVDLPTSWSEITDPTQQQLSSYSDDILLFRDKWYDFFKDTDLLTITQIYDGIDLDTANNIEETLSVIFNYYTDCLLQSDPPHCGMLYGPDSMSVITCGNYFWTKKV